MRSAEPARPARSEPARVTRAYSQPLSERRDRRPRSIEDDGPPVVGLGDHVPSFLLRPVVFEAGEGR